MEKIKLYCIKAELINVYGEFSKLRIEPADGFYQVIRISDGEIVAYYPIMETIIKVVSESEDWYRKYATKIE